MKKKFKNLISMALCIAMLVGMAPLDSEAVGSASQVLVYTTGILHEAQTREVLKLVNAERAKVGADPLVMTATQEMIAEQRALELIALFDHTRPDGSSCFSITEEAELDYSSAGENIAAGQRDAADVMDSWMNSDGHRSNILNPNFTHIGIGCFEYFGVKYWVQFFTGNPSDTEAAPATGEDNIDLGTGGVYVLDVENVEGCSIEFWEPQITLETGSKTEFDLCLYTPDLWGNQQFAGVVISAFLDDSNLITSKNLVMVDEEGYIVTVEGCKPGTDILTVKVGNLTATKTIRVIAKTEWKFIDGNWYYYENGKPVTGWKEIDGKYYYMYEDGVMASDTWIDGWYVDKSGVWIKNKKPAGWVQSGNKWWYRNEDGTYPASCWKEIDGSWYYFDASGYRVTGWKQLGGKWYYMGAEGVMTTGWQKISGSWYYFASSGAMQTGWVSVDGKWYYCSVSGAMKTGWLQLGKTWYYLQGDGSMIANGWLNDTYCFSASGAMLTGWQKINGTYYYFSGSGAKVTNKWIGNYYVGEDGKWIPNYSETELTEN